MRLLFFAVFVLFVVNIPLVGQHFICQQSRLNEMKLFKLRTIAFSYSQYVDLYCSDKGETLHIHSLHVHFRLYSHQK